MGLAISPSDLKYKYPKATVTRFATKFSGPGDGAAFNRDDLYDILPLLAAVMDELERDDATTLHFLEDLMNQEMPRFLVSRSEVFDFLTGCGREMLSYRE